MKKLIFLALLILNGCLPIVSLKEATDNLDKNTICYQSKDGIIVLADVASHCPTPHDFEEQIDLVVARVNIQPSDELLGSAFVYQRKTIFVNGHQNVAATTNHTWNEQRVSFLAWTSNWKNLTRHEIGHLLYPIKYPQRGMDVTHADCIYWTAIDPMNSGCSDPWKRGSWKHG